MLKETSIQKRLWTIVAFVIACTIFFVFLTSCSTTSYVGCYHPNTYLILDVQPDKLLIELECGGDRHYADNYYNWTDTAIGNVLTVLPEFDN